MKITVGVIFGGESVEHEVSIISASQAMHALDPEKYDVVPLYVSKKRVLYCSKDMMDVNLFTNMQNIFDNIPECYLSYDGKKTWVRPIKQSLFHKWEIALDVIIPVVHGTNCEDGTIQGYLEMMHIPYAGCDVVAAGVGQDKIVMKYILEGSGLPITPWFWLYGHELEQKKEEVLSKAEKIGYPLIVKPACCGSSVGISVAHNAEELLNCIREATKFDRKIAVEKIVKPMTEINCSVLGDCYDCQPSNLEQVMTSEELLTFHDKYEGNGKGSKTNERGMASASRLVPAPLSKELTDKIKSLAVETFKVLGSSGVCRIDFLLEKGTDRVYVNEINTIPGSLAFYLWENTGISFTELMDHLVKQAVDRQRRREKMTFSYDTNILSGYAQGATKGKLKG